MAAQKMTKTNTVSSENKKTAIKFEKDDMITCRSITNGELFMVGKKTGELYSWADYGFELDIEYQDLIYDVRSSGSSSFSLNPRFIILDEDFVEQNKDKLDPIYNSLYSTNDFREILDLPANKLKSVVEGLPKGAKDSLKGLVSTMISDGSFDSVSKIKALDEIFGTQMLQVLVD